MTNGALLSLSLKGVPLEQQPQKFELNSNGKLTLDLESGQTLAASISSNGAQLVAAGGLNMVAAGGGNIVAAGGMNMVAAGGGNLTATGPASFINANKLIGLDDSTMIGLDGGTLISRLSALISNGSSASFSGAAQFNAAGLGVNARSTVLFVGPTTGADLKGPVEINNSDLIGEKSANIRTGSLIGNDGSTLIGNDGSTIVAPAAARGKRDIRVPGDPGTILAATGSTIAGNGTFEGAGYVLTGSALRPGKQQLSGSNLPGSMQWNGPLEIRTSSNLDIQIGGPGAGVNHDRLNVTQTFQLSGNLQVSLINGFSSALTPASTFDIVVANGGVTSLLDGTRVPVTNAYGSFLVSIINGNTLRLSDYQTVPATFNRWAQRYNLTGADALPAADSSRSGMTNLMKYALGLDANASGNQGTSYGIFTDGQGKRYLTLSYTKPAGAEAPSDLLYEPQRSALPFPSPWSASPADVIPTGPAVPGPASLETVTVRSTYPIAPGQPSDYLRLRVVLPPP